MTDTEFMSTYNPTPPTVNQELARDLEKKKEIEDFFKMAFLADSAEFDTSGREFEITGVIKITCGDGRVTFYMSNVIPKTAEPGGE